MDITFDEYDKILEKYEANEFTFDFCRLDRIEDLDRLIKKKHGLEFLIAFFEYGTFVTEDDLKLKKKINTILKKHLNFVE